MAQQIHRQRQIIDRRAVVARLDAALADPAQPPPARRAAALAVLKAVLAEGRREIRDRFENHAASGTEVVRSMSFLMDQLVRVIHDHAADQLAHGQGGAGASVLGMVAVGGYGRGDLSPFSDLDLLFLLPTRAEPVWERVVEYMLYMLWDLGLKVGQATRTVDDCIRQAKADTTIRTAMLEARWLWGDQALYAELRARYQADVVKGSAVEFVEEKLAERDARHDRLGDTRYVLEPNVKEGKGGLRDLHTLFWIVRYLYGVSDIGEVAATGVLTPDAATRFAKAQNFLWTVRCHLHYLTGRPEDRLTFDVQQEIGRRMGYTDHAGSRGVERFMKHYFLIAKDVGDLTRIICAALEAQHKRKPRLGLGSLMFWKRSIDGFVIESNRLAIADPAEVEREPVRLMRLFHASHEQGIDIHPRALRLVTENLARVPAIRETPEANRLFMELLTSGRNPLFILRLMNESGFFGRFIPDFGRVVAQMQYDMYHVYTTDEHTIRAIGEAHDIVAGALEEEAPAISHAARQIQSRRALMVAVLLHDIAKGRGGDHSEIGARVARKVGPRLGLSPEESETVSWLILNHLTMTRTAFKRDLDDPKTVEDFVRQVQSPERLRLLLVLSCADIRAVGPVAWNGWKAALLRDLYMRAEQAMAGLPSVPARDRRVQKAKDALGAALPDWPAERIERHLARGYPPYWLAFDTATHVRHANTIEAAQAGGAKLTIECRPDPFRFGTEITIYTGDHPGLFARIAGAIATAGESIVDAKILTMADGMALDTFWIQGPSGGADERAAKLKKIETIVEAVLSGSMRPEVELAKKLGSLPKRAHVFKVPPRVIVDNSASKTHTVIEVNGRDRPGFLFVVTSTLTNLGLQISSAQIATYGERAVDVFYVKDIFGMKVGHDNKLREIRRQVLEALGGSPAAEPEPKPRQPPAPPPAPLPRSRILTTGTKVVPEPKE